MGSGGNDEHGHGHGGHDEPEEPAVPAAEMAANMKANTPPSFGPQARRGCLIF